VIARERFEHRNPGEILEVTFVVQLLKTGHLVARTDRPPVVRVVVANIEQHLGDEM
jgi:hypothetical protein